MDVFGVHHDLIAEYEAFTSSLVAVRDPDIESQLAGERERKTRWPDPKLALNPTFRSGGTVASLCDDGLLHPMCREYFRHKTHPNDPGSRTLSLHRHQREAIVAADRGDSHVLTTGTGSGKSLTYIVPIVDTVLRHPNPDGISAIVVYPVNALANSRLHELEKYLTWGVPDGPPKVTFARYTGQEDSGRKLQVLRNKPDILLTNYVMPEYLLTRPDERRELIGAARGLRFLALDELAHPSLTPPPAQGLRHPPGTSPLTRVIPAGGPPKHPTAPTAKKKRRGKSASDQLGGGLFGLDEVEGGDIQLDMLNMFGEGEQE
ncbi:DEAD/DEAH box helicase [Streptomyces sp. SM1]|uniref:DEAD/DEAH box helicase n=1 Tax=Streptomyces sp. SM1 TaxID=402229 RepID=UPI000CD4D7CE|nr:DEAD/DEAH box helicase [Streptomyces sp. SM1]